MKKILFVVFALIACSIIKPQDKIKEADKAIKDKKYDVAINIGKDFLNIDSTDLALKLFIKIDEVGGTSKIVKESIGDCYAKKKVIELALLNYEKAENFDSLDIQLKFKIAELLYKDKRYTESANKYLNIIKIDTTNKKALLKLGNIFYLAKLYADASVYLEKYLKIEQPLEVYIQVAKSNIEIRNYSKAYHFSTEGLKKFPNDILLKKVAATSSAWTGKHEEALSYYNQLSDTMFGKSDIKDLINAGKSCNQGKKDSLALIFYNKALSIDSTLKEVFWEVAILYYKTTNYDKAIEFFDKFLVEKPTFEPAVRFKAFSYLQKKDYANTREYLLQSIALNDTIVDTWFWLAQSFKALDSLNKAIDAYEKLIKLTENKETLYKDKLVDSYGFLGQMAFDKQNYSSAINYIKKALVHKPDNVNYNLMMASSYHSLKDYDNAVLYYKKVLKLDPKNEAAKKGLRLLSAD